MRDSFEAQRMIRAVMVRKTPQDRKKTGERVSKPGTSSKRKGVPKNRESGRSTKIPGEIYNINTRNRITQPPPCYILEPGITVPI